MMNQRIQSVLHLAAHAAWETDKASYRNDLNRIAAIVAGERREPRPGSGCMVVGYPDEYGRSFTELEVVYYADREDGITDVYAFAQDSAVNLAPMLDWDTLCDLIADKAYDAAVNQHKAQRASDAEDRAEHWRMAA